MSVKKRSCRTHWIASAVLTGALLLSGCGGSAEEVITDILELPGTEETVVETTEETVVAEETVVVTETIDNPAPVEEEITVVDAPVLSATLSGRLVDAVIGAPLEGAVVTVNVPGVTESFTTMTNFDGSYVLNSVPATSSTASFALDGYLTEQYSAVDLVADTDLNLGTIALVSNDNSGFGTLTGTILNAVNGQGVEGLTLRFRQGLNATTGDVVAETTTDVNGEYTIGNLPYGNLTCEIVGVGFNTSFANVVVLGNITQSDQNTAVSPNLSTGEIRIVLTWGETPSDLDSHLTGPQENSDVPFHVYFANRSEDLANLDVDDTSSFGPETVTIDRQINGVYRYTVYNFSNGGDTQLSASGARVQVFDSNGLIRDFQVPGGLGNLWTVFDMEGGNITPVNTITTRESNADHFTPAAQVLASFKDAMPSFK